VSVPNAPAAGTVTATVDYTPTGGDAESTSSAAVSYAFTSKCDFEKIETTSAQPVRHYFGDQCNCPRRTCLSKPLRRDSRGRLWPCCQSNAASTTLRRVPCDTPSHLLWDLPAPCLFCSCWHR
jgi:hypothetical protein